MVGYPCHHPGHDHLMCGSVEPLVLMGFPALCLKTDVPYPTAYGPPSHVCLECPWIVGRLCRLTHGLSMIKPYVSDDHPPMAMAFGMLYHHPTDHDTRNWSS